MTGFLRRLASGMLREDRAIHPAVGSLWSAPRNQEPIESFSEILVSKHPEEDRGPASIHPDRNRPVKGNTDLRTEQPSQPEHKLPAATFRPLVPPSQSIAVSAPRALHTADHNEPFAPTHPVASPESATPQFPFRSESPRLPLAPSTRIATPPPITARETTALARQPQGAQPQAAEPDIEIHIGRIEVLAVPPPPAQPAPRPARKSMDLGEYLRRDRRTR